MITTDPTPGAPCWLDLGAPDVPAAAAFYGAVLGWEYEAMGGEGEEMEGGMFKKDGKTVAGLGKLSEEGARSAWMIYYTVTDADATTQAVEGAAWHGPGAPEGPRRLGTDGAVHRPVGRPVRRLAAGAGRGLRAGRRVGLTVLDRAVHERRRRRAAVLRLRLRLAVQRHGDAGRRGHVHHHHARPGRPRTGCRAA